MDTELLLIISRATERLLIILLAGTSMLSGVYLLKKGVSGISDAEWKTAMFSLKFFKISPGIFFALFGTIVLITSINSRLDINDMLHEQNDQNTSSRRIGFYASGLDGGKKLAKSLNTIINFINIKLPNIKDVTSYDKDRLKRAESEISQFHFQNLRNRFKNDYSWYNEVYQGKLTLKTDNEKKKYNEIKEYAYDEND